MGGLALLGDTMRVLHAKSFETRRADLQRDPEGVARSAAEAECARRQRLAIPGLVGGPLVFMAAIVLFSYSAVVEPDGARYWGGVGTICLILALALLVWAGHFMDCTDKGEPEEWSRDEENLR